MNFANIKEITIPEGKVSQIVCGSTVLWSLGEVDEGLPSEYQELTWLEAAANVGAYIDLGFSFDTAATIEMSFSIADTGTTAYPFGAAENSGKYRCCISAPYSNGCY